MRKSHKIALVLVPILLAGCGQEIPTDQQRDVYTKFEDCMADWGKTELCEKMQSADAAQHAQQATGNHTASPGLIFWGPSYYPGDRAVAYNGQNIAPTSNRAMSKPFAVTNNSSLASRSSPATARATSVSRGGFGGGGHAAGGSSGG